MGPKDWIALASILAIIFVLNMINLHRILPREFSQSSRTAANSGVHWIGLQ